MSPEAVSLRLIRQSQLSMMSREIGASTRRPLASYGPFYLVGKDGEIVGGPLALKDVPPEFLNRDSK